MEHSDQDLRERFAALRREEAERVPHFTMLEQRRPAKPWPLWKPAMAFVALALAAALFLKFDQRPGPLSRGPSITEWKSPTDFLLQTPGREVLTHVPVFAQWPANTIIPTTTPKPFSKRKG